MHLWWFWYILPNCKWLVTFFDTGQNFLDNAAQTFLMTDVFVLVQLARDFHYRISLSTHYITSVLATSPWFFLSLLFMAFLFCCDLNQTQRSNQHVLCNLLKKENVENISTSWTTVWQRDTNPGHYHTMSRLLKRT